MFRAFLNRNQVVLAEAGASGGTTSAGVSGSTAAGTGSAAGAGTSGSEWFSSLPAEEKGFIQTKGYKDLTEAVKSHRHLETLLGAPKERLLKLPEKADDKAGWDAVYGRLGRPEKADGYDPKTFGEGTSPDDAKWLQDTFHGLNLTKAQGEQLAQKWAEKMKGVNVSMEEAKANASNQQLEKLKQEWGEAYNDRVGVSNKIAQQLGISEEQYAQGEAAMGVDGWAKHLYSMADKFGIKFDEAGFHRGDGPASGGITPDQARETLKRLQNDAEWVKRFMNGGVEERTQMDKIHQLLYPGFVTH